MVLSFLFFFKNHGYITETVLWFSGNNAYEMKETPWYQGRVFGAISDTHTTLVDPSNAQARGNIWYDLYIMCATWYHISVLLVNFVI